MLSRLLWVLALLALISLPLTVRAAQHAQVMSKLNDEMRDGLQRRKLEPEFKGLTAFTIERLQASAGTMTFSDKTGNCRLSWLERMLGNPQASVGEAEVFTRTLHQAALNPNGLPSVVKIAAEKLDAPIANTTTPALTLPRGADSSVARVVRAVALARDEYARAVAPLTAAEMEELRAELYVQAAGPRTRGAFFANKEKGRRVCDLLERMDRPALMRAGLAMAGLADADLLKRLSHVKTQRTPALPGVQGKLTAVIATPAGRVIIGGKGANTYQLDEMQDVCAVIDQGGDDVYIEGTLSADRPVLVIIDLAGNDTYRGEKPGIQGGAVLGVSLLIDAAGNDTYHAGDVAQGSALGGIGILLDLAGDDAYRGVRRAQGQAVGGLGLLLDRAGNDAYRAALLSQGVGGPLGFGLLDDLAGNDHYYAGGITPNSYGDSPGYDGWSQGMGIGPRGIANGGIGVLLDGAGDDEYEADYFSHAGGYWFALGFARDFGGNDRRYGATRTAFDGSERKEKRFLRWGIGFGCHYAAGYLFDDSGDDLYQGDHASVAFAWDIAVTALIDMAGNDRYEVSSSGLCQAHNAGLAVLCDAEGDDVYTAGALGIAADAVEYHPGLKAGNFTFFIDWQGEDRYPNGLTNNAEVERGWAGGFVIDR